MIDCSTSHEEEKVQNYRGKKRLIFNRDLMFAKVVKQKKTFYLSSSACMLGFAESSLIRCETVSRLMIGIHLSSSWFPTNFACENEEVANVKQFSWPWALFLAPVVVRVSRIFQTMLQVVKNWSLINVYKKHFFLLMKFVLLRPHYRVSPGRPIQPISKLSCALIMSWIKKWC